MSNSDTNPPSTPGVWEGKVYLQPFISADNVNQSALLDAWDILSPVSVEATLANKALSIYDFAESCLNVAAIQAYVKQPNKASNVEKFQTYPAQSSQTLSGEFQDPVAESTAEPLHLWEAYPTIYNTAPLGAAISADQAVGDNQTDATPNATVLSWTTVGLIYVHPSPMTSEASVGVAVLPQWRGKGLGMQAVKLALQWTVDEIKCHRVQAMVMNSPCRDRALRLFTAVGFVHEGIRRRSVFGPQGEWVDVTYMGMLDTEWLMRERCFHVPRNMWDELFDRHRGEGESCSCGTTNSASSEEQRARRQYATSLRPPRPSNPTPKRQTKRKTDVNKNKCDTPDTASPCLYGEPERLSAEALIKDEPVAADGSSIHSFPVDLTSMRSPKADPSQTLNGLLRAIRHEVDGAKSLAITELHRGTPFIDNVGTVRCVRLRHERAMRNMSVPWL
ncbi:hypothetical protein A0H81_02195 [Grifola frondosa]|uniref:N-acetyltransferase domain-containing protein n=1 Tax=Grifola frondosa TaxID=5627 RepID=A0A1C7MMQ3_GRIFR|nr:hypothetical protein A0H81_02195 [Grifola frondosa]